MGGTKGQESLSSSPPQPECKGMLEHPFAAILPLLRSLLEELRGLLGKWELASVDLGRILKVEPGCS